MRNRRILETPQDFINEVSEFRFIKECDANYDIERFVMVVTAKVSFMNYLLFKKKMAEDVYKVIRPKTPIGAGCEIKFIL